MASPLSTSFSSTAGSRRPRAGDALTGAHWLFGPHRLDVDSRQLVREGHRMQLDERGFAVLTCLLRNAGRVVPRAELVAEAWPGVGHVTDSAVSKTMRRLRTALGSEAGRTLATVYGVGYRMATPAILVPAGATLPSRGSGAHAATGTVRDPALPLPPPAQSPSPAAASNAPSAGAPAGAPAAAPAGRDRAQRHRIVVIAVAVLCVLLAGWLLLAPVAR